MADGMDASMAGKVCLVTGGTAGIGLVTAEGLARRGATVVLVGRNREKAEATADRIRREVNNPAVEALVADLSAQAEVRRLAGEFLARHGRLDVLVNNAGALFAERRESVDGIEMTFALNHLAYFLLTDLLLETLKASAPARVVNVSSMAHQGTRLDPDAVRARRGLEGGFGAYGQSKLANLLFTYELARRLAGTGVTVNALHPGFVATDFTAGNGWLGWTFRRMATLFAIPPEAGARTTLFLATAPEVAGLTGRYFIKAKEAASSAATRDVATARRLWEISEELTGIAAGSRA